MVLRVHFIILIWMTWRGIASYSKPTVLHSLILGEEGEGLEVYMASCKSA